MDYEIPRPIFYVVPNRSQQTLEFFIKHHVVQGTTVCTDEWRGYGGLAAAGYNHLTVNHSRTFVSNTG